MRGLTIFFLLWLLPMTTVLGAAMSESSYRPTSQVLENDRREITDEDIRKAFEAEPQIVFPLRVAWYNMGTDSIVEGIDISDLPVESSYMIPKTLIEGLVNSSQTSGVYGRPVTLSLAALRLAAARAKCDILVLVGSSCVVKNAANFLVVFNVLLLPVLFNPAFNVTIDYSSEMYVFDVRNEYLYGQYSYDSGPMKSDALTLARRDAVATEMKAKLLDDAARAMSRELIELIESYLPNP